METINTIDYDDDTQFFRYDLFFRGLRHRKHFPGCRTLRACPIQSKCVGAKASVGLFTLPHFLPKLVQSHPELEIKLVHDLSRKIMEKVIAFEIDFGIVVNPISHPDVVITELGSDEVTFWTSQAGSINQSSCLTHGVLICDPELSQTQSLLAQLRKHHKGFKRVVQSSSLEVVAQLTAQGMGIGVLPGRVASQVAAPGLKKWSKELPVVKDRICLVYRADAQKSVASKHIVKSIKLAFA
jgi:DNA-binding transcriptional LysR family regulator